MDPLIRSGSTLTDIMAHSKFVGDGRPGTQANGIKAGKFDYILMSPNLANKVIKCGIERKGAWGVRKVRSFHIWGPSIRKWMPRPIMLRYGSTWPSDTDSSYSKTGGNATPLIQNLWKGLFIQDKRRIGSWHSTSSETQIRAALRRLFYCWQKTHVGGRQRTRFLLADRS
jgi:hypothetical protein